jgi:hypothetical protein
MLYFKALSPIACTIDSLNRFQETYAKPAHAKNAIFRLSASINCIPDLLPCEQYILVRLEPRARGSSASTANKCNKLPSVQVSEVLLSAAGFLASGRLGYVPIWNICQESALRWYVHDLRGPLLFVWIKENPVKACLGILFAIVVALPASLAGPNPGPGANQVFLFASPNTRKSLTDEKAKEYLTSSEQSNVTAVADRAACALTHSVQIADSLGIYDKSSENSFILEADLERKQPEYLAALLGLYSRQEFILLFLEQASGLDRLWIIKTPQSLEVVIATLRKLKLTPVTVRMEKEQNEIWFIDVADQRAGALKLFTSDVNGRASLTAGVAEMLGNQDRATAVKGWRQQISAFEQRSGPHLSEQISSKVWRDATAVHTCSKEMSIP